MEYTCHHCGTEVVEGAPFCKSCGAPQIRVVAPVEVSAEHPQHPGAFKDRAVATEERPKIAWATALSRAALAGILTTLIMLIAGSPFLLLIVLPLGGAMAASFYASGKNAPAINGAIGARLGALAGLFGFLLHSLVSATVLVTNPGKTRAALQQQIEQAMARNPNPEAAAAMQHLLSPAGIAVLITITIVLSLVLFLMLFTLGGAVTGSALGKRRRPH